ncbi:MAG: hypothetical protein H8E51_08635 [Bacteroidetes bacterium]|nr:hypothetical protein [Bacteroidota bacterium]
MRLLPGQPPDVAGESITSYSLMAAAVNNPDILSRVWQVYREEDASPISAILASRGYFTKGLRENTFNSSFRTVGSNHIMYPIASTNMRKLRFAANASGLTYSSASYSTKPGYKGTPFYIYLDSNWARPKEVIELDDNKTQLYVYDWEEPVEVDGVWRYEVKLVTREIEDYVDTDLLAENNEAGVGMTAYEHDFSETGSEKYTFDGWGHAYLNLQRIKMSFSGTAQAMKTSKDWYAFQNSKGMAKTTYIEQAERTMYKRASQYHEYQLVFGKGTVTVDGNVFLHDKKGREIMMGDGLLYGGDGAIDRPMTHKGWTMKYLESLMRDVDVRAGHDGKKEAVVAGGFSNIAGLFKMFKDEGYETMNNNVEGSGSEKGINMDYSYFEWMGVRIIPVRYRWFDSVARPTKYMSNGEAKGSWDGLIIPLGKTESGDNMVELIQLRPPAKGSVSGINKGGAMASSVDGESRHFLWQSGIISRTNIYRLFMPYAA